MLGNWRTSFTNLWGVRIEGTLLTQRICKDIIIKCIGCSVHSLFFIFVFYFISVKYLHPPALIPGLSEIYANNTNTHKSRVNSVKSPHCSIIMIAYLNFVLLKTVVISKCRTRFGFRVHVSYSNAWNAILANSVKQAWRLPNTDTKSPSVFGP